MTRNVVSLPRCSECGQHYNKDAPFLMETCVVVYKDKRCRLSRQQADILNALLSAYPATMRKSPLIERVWPENEPDNVNNALAVQVTHIRRKLQEADMPIHVATEWAIGFRLEMLEEKV
jgi:OmpR family two-component system response regulator YxdJ